LLLSEAAHCLSAHHTQLDAGVLERIMLLTRDESSMLVASYADLKRCVESSYAELQSQASSAASQGWAADASM